MQAWPELNALTSHRAGAGQSHELTSDCARPAEPGEPPVCDGLPVNIALVLVSSLPIPPKLRGAINPTMNRVEVAAAVIERDDGRFLLAQRPPGKAYAGYWEFPGGKIEPGESPRAALARELHEELGIDVQRAYPWLTREYDYEHAAVRLRFFRVPGWTGVPHGKENQAFTWQRIDAIDVGPLLPANGPILKALALPVFYGISNVAEVGLSAFLDRLDAALRCGLRLVQVREKAMQRAALERTAEQIIEVAHRFGAKVLMNGPPELAAQCGADGVHLTSSRLMGLRERPPLALVGASCHDEGELARATELGCDFAVLGPVMPTASHPGAPTLGWARFASLVEGCRVPVFAVGGLGLHDREHACAAGAHGIAAIREAWGSRAAE